MKIGILTGGGDVPGLNPCIKGVVNRAIDAGWEVVGIRRGWGGLLRINPEDPQTIAEHTLKLDRLVVRTIDRTGGTFLHTSRTNPQSVRAKDIPPFLKDAKVPEKDGKKDFTAHVLRNLEHLGIERLVAIGGDDTLSYAVRLDKEGFPVIAIPKTMDNDVYGTDYCIGFSTSVTRSSSFINQLRTCAGSHERIFVAEVFGRNSGESALFAGYLGCADRTLISEVPFDVKKLADMALQDVAANPSRYAIIVMSEGAIMHGGSIVERGETDAYGHRKLGGIGQLTAEELKKLTGNDMMTEQITYLMRSGPPDTLDLMVGFNFANLAVDLLEAGEKGRMVGIRGGRYAHIPVQEAAGGIKRVDVDRLYDRENYRPKIRSVEGLPMFLF